MTLIRNAAAMAALATLFATQPASAQSAPADSSRRAADGAYTVAQATDGEAAFRGICANCHGPAEFSGSMFRKNWTGRPVYDLFDQLRNTMPLDNPGGLSPDQYAAVIAYIMKLNEFPAGSSPLPTSDAELRLIRF